MLLSLDNVWLERGGRIIQQGLHWRIDKPGLYAVTGPSGCGKSSLLMAMAGLLPIRQGTLTWTNPPGPGQIAMVWQDLHLIPRDTVLHNAACGALHRLPWWRSVLGFPKDIRRLAANELDAVGIGHLARRWSRDVSGGERARCGVARAMVQNARVVLADEPVAALDERTAHRVMERLCQHAAAGHVVVCALHQPELIAQYAQAVLTLTIPEANIHG